MLSVLVVDDHPAILQHVSTWVRSTGVAEVVATLSDPAAVVETWDERRPDVVLCDVHMPVTDGVEVCGRLRELHPDAVVVLFSARDDHTIRERALAAGAAGMIAKTASPSELAAALRAATGQTR